MRVRRIVLCAATLAALTLAIRATAQSASAAGVTNSPSFDVRLSIAESRMTTIERDMSRLATIPTQLTRIEVRLDALQEQAKGWSGNANTIVIATITTLIGAGVGMALRPKTPPKT